MPTRRDFLGALAIPAAAAVAASFPSSAARAATRGLPSILSRRHDSPALAAQDEDFWFQVGQAFTVDRSILNLNNGGVSPAPAIVQAAQKRHLDYANSTPPPVALWRVQDPQLVSVKERLAAAFGGTPEELAITRNASESLEICLFGHDLKAGDEVLTTTQDYPRMISTLKQRERREGIVLTQIKIPVPADNPDEVVSLFERAITPRTKLILMSHVINLTGQVMPVKKVVAMARARGIPVVVDGAHALAHLDFRLTDLECDFYGVSLHKWLFAPHGTGLLYVRRDKIKGLWPLMGAAPGGEDTITKFEEIGTHPAAGYLAIAEAVEFHLGLGAARKLARLIHLRDYWTSRLLKNDRVRLHTSLKPGMASGIGNVEVLGIDQLKLADWLWEKHRILVTAIKHEECAGLRVTPSVYTQPGDLDRFCDAVEQAIRTGLV
jgi:isopenicillin-N epimerase